MLTIILILLLSGCAQEQDSISNSTKQKYITYTSDLPSSDCRLCGSGESIISSDYQDQNNVGIIDLNTFEIIPIEINRYDSNGALVQENTGHITTHSFKSQKDDFFTSVMEETNRGYALATVSCPKDQILHIEKAASFLCKDCLNTIISEIYEGSSGIGIINFSTKQIRLFETCTTGFSCGDFYVLCDFKEHEENENMQRMDAMIFYCPVRYEKESDVPPQKESID